MKRLRVASIELEVTVGGSTVSSRLVFDHEEIDGWVGEDRLSGQTWRKWRRADGAVVGVDYVGVWHAAIGGADVRSASGRIRFWKTAAAARAAVDREHPPSALARRP